MKNDFPFNLFNQGLIETSSEHLKEMEAKRAEMEETATKILVFLDGLTLEEVDQVMMIVRSKCQEKAVVQI